MTAATHLTTPLLTYPAHWQGYFQQNWENESFSPDAVPFFATSLWKDLTPAQKDQLAWGFVQINAEIIIHLEQGLLLATRELTRRGQNLSHEMQEFVQDEVLHIKAFRDFLTETPELKWPSQRLFLHRGLFTRKLSAWLFRWEPLAVFLTGAKTEIYAVQYYQTVKKQSGPNSRWAALVHHHAIDEATHIEQDFLLLRNALATMSTSARWRLYAATLLSVLLTQLCLAQSAFALVGQVFPERHFARRGILTARFAAWVLWTHPAFPATRKVFSRLLKKESDPYFRRFAFLGW